jgi:hypothetical protein
VQERRRQCRQGHETQQDESQRRRKETIKRISGVDGGVGGNGSSGGEDARNMLGGNGNDAGGDLVATRPFARGDQCSREQCAKDDPHAGPDKPLLDRIAHQEDSTQRQRQTADPHHPLGAESLFQRGRCHRGDGRGRNRGLARRLRRCGLRYRFDDDWRWLEHRRSGRRRWRFGWRGDGRCWPGAFQLGDAQFQHPHAFACVQRHYQCGDGYNWECEDQQDAE